MDGAKRSQSHTQGGVGPVADLTVSQGNPILPLFDVHWRFLLRDRNSKGRSTRSRALPCLRMLETLLIT